MKSLSLLLLAAHGAVPFTNAKGKSSPTTVAAMTTAPTASTVVSPLVEDLQDAENSSVRQDQEMGLQASSCGAAAIKLDSFIHKTKYTVGVHATHGLDKTFYETKLIFEDYLTATAGKKFDPPVTFEVVPDYFVDLFHAIEEDEMDFLYSNPGVYSCIGVEHGATALTTAISRLSTRGQIFDLDVYGGVIAVRHDRDDINTLQDLKDKVIGAGNIIDLMGGQMQIYEMFNAGMSYVNDPKQFVFTKNQEDVVLGVLSGRFDVGFIRTDQIELTQDRNGDFVDPDLFKILEPKIHILETGELFPFLHSTEIFPEWPLAALPGVPADVQGAVQDALIEFGAFADIGDKINACRANEHESWCDSVNISEMAPAAPCQATEELVLMASEAEARSHIAGFRTALSYFELRSVQQAAGFLIQDSKDEWHCTRPNNLFEGITCPEGYFKRHETEFHKGCSQVDLYCDDTEDYDCFCKPCVKAHEVDVYFLEEGKDDPHLHEYYGDAYPGCDKMEICAGIQQGQSVKLRIYDNLMRVGAKVVVEVHAGDAVKQLPITALDGDFAYEFTVTDKEVQVQVIEILVDGKPISTSPIRVVVENFDCEVTNPGEHRESNNVGECVCAGHTYELGNICLESQWFFLIIFGIVFLVVGTLIFFYLGYKKKQNDSVWHVLPEELHFNEPPEIIGQGAFGVVVLGQYRGTKVAVKRVLPPKIMGGGSRGSLTLTASERQTLTNSVEINNNNVELDADSTKAKKEKKRRNSVSFDGKEATDIESGDALSKSGSGSYDASACISGSNRDWERLLSMRHSDNDVLKILESATSSNHGSGEILGSVSKSQVVLRYVPMWLRWDEHSRRLQEFQQEMRLLSRLRHPCITTVMGAVVSSRVDPMLVLEYMEYGSLYDLLHNETMTPSGEIILQISRDIVQGLQFLHASKPPILHGDLKAKNILVDSRFRAKVADFGFSHLKTKKMNNVLRGTPYYMAPEYLRRRTEYTTQCDIYSLAMIFYEIYARQSPFEGEDPRKVLPKVCHPRLNKRPTIPEACPPKMVELIKKCWSANAFFRPQAKDVDYALVEMSTQDAEPLKTAEELARDSLRRKPTSLYDVFPKKVAEALKAGKKVEAESHDMVSIFFSDIVGFTTISQSQDALKVSHMLDRLYTAFDDLSRKHKVFKVETIGDAWMGVTNLDNDEFETHARQIAEFAQDAIRAASNIAIDEDDPSLGYVNIRVGIHSGPVVSNVVGSLNPRYGLFGDSVNTASRMESNSMPGRIHCSFATADLLKQQAPDIRLQIRGLIKVKGKGKMKTFWVGPENLAMLSPMSISMRAMEPLSERDEEDQISHNPEDYSEHISDLNDDSQFDEDFRGASEKSEGAWTAPLPPSVSSSSATTAAASNGHDKLAFSTRTTATASTSGASSSSEGSNDKSASPLHSPPRTLSPLKALKNSLVGKKTSTPRPPSTIRMDGSVQNVPANGFPLAEY